MPNNSPGCRRKATPSSFRPSVFGQMFVILHSKTRTSVCMKQSTASPSETRH